VAKLKIGILRERKTPPDYRTPLPPRLARRFLNTWGDHAEVYAERSPTRCFPDEEYRREGIPVVDSLTHCDLLIGVKEVPPPFFIPDKTYMIFSHTIKKQPYNRELLRTVLTRRVRLIDYELLKDSEGRRVVGFGVFAGMVGAHYALIMIGKRWRAYELPQARTFHSYEEVRAQYPALVIPPLKILVTGRGRVGQGAERVLQDAGIEKISVDAFLSRDAVDRPVYTVISSAELYRHRQGRPFEHAHFYAHPEEYESAFKPFLRTTDVLIHGIYWEPRYPRLLTRDDVDDAFRIRSISDISVDIDGSLPFTFRATTPEDPFYGVDLRTFEETAPFQTGVVDMMTIDNLPNELPRDASEAFGKVMAEKILPRFIQNPHDRLFTQATIADAGRLTPPFAYLSDWVAGREA